jgi:hypothetical protein
VHLGVIIGDSHLLRAEDILISQQHRLHFWPQKTTALRAG